MVWLWRYIFGFLKIKIYGENIEKTINTVSANGIKIWNLHYHNSCIYGNISIKSFLRLRDIKRIRNCKIKIIKKHGLIFKLKRYNKRIGFAVGLTVFLFTLYFLSNFVWIINVEGNKNISTQQIKSICKEMGIYEGVKKNRINSKYNAQRLQLMQKEIAWCSLNVEGSILNINLTEQPVSEKEERQSPSNLKALTDGKIIKIDVTSGNVPVKVGDVVSKGEILVSGIIQNSSSTLFVHSSGEIIAETQRVFSASGDFVMTETIETDEVITRRTIDFFNFKIPLFLGKIEKEYTYKSEIKNFKLFGNKIPVKIAKEKYIITFDTEIRHNKESLEKILYKNICDQVDKYNFITAKEVNREIVETEKGILLKITYNCTENIAQQDEILLSKEN